MSDGIVKPPGRGKSRGLTKAITYVITFFSAMAAIIVYATGLRATGNSVQMSAFGLLLLGQFTATLVHELGHAIAAAIAGWRVIVFAVRPFAFQIPSMSFVLAGKEQFPDYQGFVAAVPGGRDETSVRRWALFVAGGPLASLSFALYLAGMAWVLSTASLTSVNIRLLTAICVGFALQSLCVCLCTLLPRSGPGSSSDGWKLREALTNTANTAERGALPWVLLLMKHRIRPRDLPQWMLDDIRAKTASVQHQRFADTLDIARLLDAARPDFLAARDKIEVFRNRHGADGWLCGCDAYVAAMHEGDIRRAELALAVPHAQDTTPALTLAARAALCARQGYEKLTKRHLADMDIILRCQSPFSDRCYADIRRNIETLLRQVKAS